MKSQGETYLESLIKQTRAMFKNKSATDFVDFLCEKVTKYAEAAWREYITGKRSNYYVTAAQFRILYKVAIEEYAHLIIEEAINQDKLVASVNKDGELVYKLREDSEEKN